MKTITFVTTKTLKTISKKKFMSLFQKFPFYRLFTICVFIIALPFLLAGCDNDDNDDNTYYVKYEINISTNRPDDANTVAITNEKGESVYSTYNGTVQKEIVCGPVPKGFTAKLVGSNLSQSTSHSFSISVAKGKGPFVFKVGGDRSYVDISYTID